MLKITLDCFKFGNLKRKRTDSVENSASQAEDARQTDVSAICGNRTRIDSVQKAPGGGTGGGVTHNDDGTEKLPKGIGAFQPPGKKFKASSKMLVERNKLLDVKLKLVRKAAAAQRGAQEKQCHVKSKTKRVAQQHKCTEKPECVTTEGDEKRKGITNYEESQGEFAESIEGKDINRSRWNTRRCNKINE